MIIACDVGIRVATECRHQKFAQGARLFEFATPAGPQRMMPHHNFPTRSGTRECGLKPGHHIALGISGGLHEVLEGLALIVTNLTAVGIEFILIDHRAR